MAMMIALSSLCLSAFADTATVLPASTIVSGTYQGYEVIKFNYNMSISYSFICQTLREYNAKDSAINYMYFVLLDFDENGKPHTYTAGSSRRFVTANLTGATSDSYINVMFNGAFQIHEELTVPKETSYYYQAVNYYYDESHYYCRYRQSNQTEDQTYSYPIDYTDGVAGFNGFSDNDKYLVIVPYKSSDNNISTVLGNLFIGSIDDLELEKVPEAGFITAKTPEAGKITLIDWVGAGTQYPLFDFWINDNKNYDKYILRISSNESYSQVLYDKGNHDNTIDWLGYNSAFSTQQFNLAFQALYYDQLQWDLVRNITDTTFTFAETDTSNRRGYVICLSDYFTVVEFLLYRAEIIDQTTGKLVASTYFSTNRTYNKGESGYGSQVSHYDEANDDGWNTDLDDGKFGNATETEKKDQMIVDNKNDIVITYDPAGISLDSFTDYLSGVSGQLGGFFTACWGIVPAEIMVIFLGGLTVMVTCAIILVFARR